MKTGVIGDIQGNREALAAVLAELDRHGVTRVVCVGDIVGYNADPNECVAMVRSRCAAAIAGIHDLIAIGRLDFGRCPTQAEYALRQTRRELDFEARAWLASLPAQHVLEEGEVSFFGASYEQRAYRVGKAGVDEISAPKVFLERGSRYFVNPGSVDASRSRGPRLAQCALFDKRRMSVEFLRVPYHSAAAEAKAAVFGYRINALTDQLYALKRLIGRASPARSPR